MKTLTLIMTLVTFNAFASDTESCDVEVSVAKIMKLNRLNDVTAYVSYGENSFDEREMIATIKVMKVTEASVYTGCWFKPGNELTLHVNKADHASYKVGEKLKLRYLNFGNRGSSRVVWEVL